MKHLTKLFRATIAIAIMLCVALPTFAHDFEVNGIYYIYLDETAKTVAVTYKGDYYDSYSNEYTGAVSIPSSVTYNSTTYSVTSIGYRAFAYCDGLTSVTIPNSVTSIGSTAFYSCDGLTEVNITDLSAWCKIDFGSSSANPLYYAKKLKLNGTEIKNLVIPNDITEIKYAAFYNCSGLTSVTIPNSVTSIGYEAFSGCTGLTSVTIGNSVTSIGDYAFDDCSNLKFICNLSKLTLSKGSSSYGYLAYYASYVINAPNGFIDGDFVWNIADNINTLIAYCGNASELILPNNFNGETYVIGDYAFYNCSGLTSITIPNSVTTIGDGAFYYCTGLTSVTIGNSVTSIGEDAFYNTGWYKKQPDGILYLDNYCLGYKVNKPTGALSIKEGTRLIGDEAFWGCTDLTSVTIPNSVTSIGSTAFYSCDGLTSITIPNSVTSIGDGAFRSCDGLTSVTIGNSVTEIGEDAFAYCSGLTSVNFNAENCTSMGSYDCPVFNYCTNLKTLNIGNSVKTIPNYAFYYCDGLTSITIPNSVTTIGDYAFRECTGLTEVNISDLSAWCKIDFGGYSANPLYYAKKLKLNGNEIKDLVIPNDITEIKDYAFRNCTGLTSVTIPNSVTSIGGNAFSNCSGLTELIIADGATSISGLSFPSSPITTLYLGRNTSEVFMKKQTSLKKLTIGNSVTSICDNAFSGCTGLTEVNFNAENCTSMGSSSYPVFSGCSNLKTLNIGNYVKTIPNYAFYGCTGLTSVTIPNSVTSIGGNAFSNCSGLTELIIADGATSISGLSFPNSPITTLYLGRNTSEAFMKNKTSLKVLTIGNSVTSICDNAFSGCTGLTSVTIPNSVTSICDNAFSGCTGLTEVNFNAENCTSMGSSSYPVFKGCTNLKTINIGNSVKTIPNYAFYECSGLTSVTIPNSVTSICDNAFSGCTGLTEVTIPSSVTSIGDKAFWGCNKLISSEIIDKTQTTVSIALATPTKYQTGITTNENEKIISESNNIFIKGLKPNTKYTYNSSLIFNDIFCDINSFSFTTKDLIFSNSDVIGVTSASSKAYCEGDVSVIECGINWGNSSVEYNNLDSISAYNLDPNTTYYVYYFLNTKEGGEYSTSWSIRTKILSWNAGEFTATSTTSARLSVETNCDATEGTGYEWIRYDAPDNLTPNKAPCPIVNGMLRGSLRGLNSNVYYKCRPYYTSSSGKTHYGAWFTIFTGDANVYFDPEVSTYDNTVVDNTAIINGYALAGSDDILEQGFEYWNASATPSADGSMGIMTVKASGISMSATIANLNYNSTYRYRAFAKTANGIFYGSEKEFTTSNDPLGIEGVEVDDNAVEVARYDIHGRLLSKPARGFNIVIYSDGTTRKEIVK